MAETGEAIRTVVVEDDPLTREKLLRLIAAEGDLEVVAAPCDGVEAARVIAATRPDLVFLDIQMPGQDGFAIVESVGVQAMPVTIFATAMDQFALKAFEVHALDYLLKPFDAARFRAAVARARETVRQRREAGLRAELRDLMATVRRSRRCGAQWPVKVGEQYTFVKTDAIEWVESSDNYVTLHTSGRRYMLRETLSSIEEKLDPERFVRVRASAIVNLDFVTAVRPWSGTEYQLILSSGTVLLSTRKYRDRVKRLLSP